MGSPIIIVVDDQKFFCDTIETILKNKYEVHSFYSGKDAIKYLEGNPADMVLLDYVMPELTGYETMMRIRAINSVSKVPIIFLTAELNERMKTEMIDRGACDYICKPIDASVLKTCIEKHLPHNTGR